MYVQLLINQFFNLNRLYNKIILYNMQIIKLKNTSYYTVDDIKKEHPKIFTRCKKLRNIIHIKKLK